jgi:hypothetical protein
MTAIQVTFAERKVKYKEGCKSIMDIVEKAYSDIDDSLRTAVESEEIPTRREGFLQITADILERVLQAELFENWRILREITVELEPPAHSVYLRITQEVFNKTLITYLGSDNHAKGLRLAAQSVTKYEIKDRFVLMHEIYCRLIAIALSNNALCDLDYYKNGHDILRILRSVSAEISSQRLTYKRSAFASAPSFLSGIGADSTTPFTTMLKEISRPLQQLHEVIEAVNTLKLNETALMNAMRYLLESQRIVRSQMVAELSYKARLELTPEMLNPRMLGNTFEVKHRECASENASNARFSYSKHYSRLSTILYETDTLIRLFQQISVASNVGGWTFWLMNIIDIELLSEAIDEHFDSVKQACKSMEEEIPGFVNSYVGLALNDNNAWSSSVKLSQLNSATRQRLALLADPLVREQVCQLNKAAFSELVSIHNTTRFKFIHEKTMESLLDSHSLFTHEDKDNGGAQSSVDLSSDHVSKQLTMEAIKLAAHMYFSDVKNVKVMSGREDKTKYVIGDLTHYLHQALKARSSFRVKNNEVNFFKKRLIKLLSITLFCKNDEQALGLVLENFSASDIKACVNEVYADLAELRDSHAAMAHSKNNTPEQRITFTAKLAAGNKVKFEYTSSTSSIGLIELPNTYNEGTPYQQVRRAIDFSHDKLTQQAVVELIGLEIFDLLQKQPSSSMFCGLRAKCPELFQRYTAFLEKASETKHPCKKSLKAIQAICQQPATVYQFVRFDLEAEGRYTLGLLKAWAKINDVNLTIFQQQNDKKPPVLSETIKGAESTHQVYLLAETPYSFRVLQPSGALKPARPIAASSNAQTPLVANHVRRPSPASSKHETNRSRMSARQRRAHLASKRHSSTCSEPKLASHDSFTSLDIFSHPSSNSLNNLSSRSSIELSAPAVANEESEIVRTPRTGRSRFRMAQNRPSSWNLDSSPPRSRSPRQGTLFSRSGNDISCKNVNSRPTSPIFQLVDSQSLSTSPRIRASTGVAVSKSSGNLSTWLDSIDENSPEQPAPVKK